MTYIAAGACNTFAINKKGQLLAWSTNNFGQTSLTAGASEPDNFIERPTIVFSLSAYSVAEIKDGHQHSIACCEDGTVLTWGRCDDGQTGIKLENLPLEDLLLDSRDWAPILTKPSVVPNIRYVFVTAGTDNSFALTSNGEAYSWGFSDEYRTSHGTDSMVLEAKRIQGAALAAKKLNFAGCGGQFSILAEPAVEIANSD